MRFSIKGPIVAGFFLFGLSAMAEKPEFIDEYNNSCRVDSDCEVQLYAEYWVGVNRVNPGNLIVLGGPGCKRKKLEEKEKINVRCRRSHCLVEDPNGKLTDHRLVTCLDSK